MMSGAVVLGGRKQPDVIAEAKLFHQRRNELIGRQASEPPVLGRHNDVEPVRRMRHQPLPGEPVQPSYKFIAGMTCRSCHIRNERTVAAATGGDAIRGQAEACSSCHRTEYRRVLNWWLDGTRQRTRQVAAYVGAAATDLADVQSDSARALVASAEAMMQLVSTAGGQHNLELTDRIFRQSVDRVRQAYVLAGRVPPPAPALGSAAHEGTCTHCHYSPDDPWDFRRMSDAFHRDVLKVERR